MSRGVEVFNGLSALSLCLVHKISAGVTIYSVILVLDTYLNISLLDVLSYSMALRGLKIRTARQTDAGGWLTQAGA
jgi:hypothetical protein